MSEIVIGLAVWVTVQVYKFLKERKGPEVSRSIIMKTAFALSFLGVAIQSTLPESFAALMVLIERIAAIMATAVAFNEIVVTSIVMPALEKYWNSDNPK